MRRLEKARTRRTRMKDTPREAQGRYRRPEGPQGRRSYRMSSRITTPHAIARPGPRTAASRKGKGWEGGRQEGREE
eukprot:15597088-Heterocapsa_arctica.AAC.1